ncbi:hypothetical protein ACFP56_02030 [Paenibacillus septentrionalis]|uniref:DUF5668 domain-containing protein n=1 Tax=Paenibacillus septentrionalis TaxID=429342 RepID=A0ABW1V246_9BACL
MNNRYSAGIILLIVGIVILLGKAGLFSFLGMMFWPLLVLIPGILIHVLYFGRVLPAITLIPAGMLVVYAVLFIFCNIFGWDSLRYLWPLFIFGVAVGLFEYHLFGSPKQRYIKTSAIGLGAASLICLLLIALWGWGIYVVALICVLVGLYLMFGSRVRW